MQGHQKLALLLAIGMLASCRSERPMSSPIPLDNNEDAQTGTPVGDDRTAMEAAVDTAGAPHSGADMAGGSSHSGGMALAPDAPDSYTVKRGDTLWGIAKVFLKDPWYWPEIWQVNPQVQNPHLIYPGDTLRLVYTDGQPRIMLQRGDSARVSPRIRSQPLEAAVTTIPYETVAAFMSKPSVLSKEQIKGAPYVLATRDMHVVMSEGNTLYARGFHVAAELGTHYNVVRVGEPLRDPDDDSIVGYDGIYTGSGHVTRGGDPTTLILTESTRETVSGDKLFTGGVDVPLDFIPSSPKARINGRIMAVSDGVTVIGQFAVVVINRGVRDGLRPGNVLAIFAKGNVIRDDVSKGHFALSTFMSKKVELPSERSGTFMVFKTFDNMSYGLVMEATDLIRVADRVENP